MSADALPYTLLIIFAEFTIGGIWVLLQIVRLVWVGVNGSAGLVFGVPGRPLQPGASNAGSAVR